MKNVDAVRWRTVAKNELLHGWGRWASFSCIWLWSCLTFAMTSKEPIAIQLPGVLSCPNEITLIAAVATLFLILFFTESVMSIIDSRLLMTLSGILLTTASLSFVVGVHFSIVWLYVSGMVLGGAAIAFLKIAWGEMYSRMSLRQGLFSMGYSLIISVSLYFLVQAMPFFEQAGFLFLAALACAPLAYIGTQNLEQEKCNDKKSSSTVAFSFSLLLLPALVALAYGMVKGFLPGISAPGDFAIDVSRGVAEIAAGILLLVFACRLGKRLGAAQIYACALVFVVVGLALFLLQTTPVWVAFGVHEVGFSLFYFFMVVYWGDLSRRTGMGIVRIYAIGYFVFQFVQFFGTLVGYYFLADGEGPGTTWTLMALILAFFIVALLLLLNPRSSLQDWLVADRALEIGDEIPIACAQLASDFKLSPREREVFSLQARGRNASSIARLLCISPDTAKTHIKNIYRKLDIHTQQELIDLVEQEK